jgi:hypothetical protein
MATPVTRDDDELATIKAAVVILTKPSSRRARREIVRAPDAFDQENRVMTTPPPNPENEEEIEGGPDVSAPVG